MITSSKDLLLFLNMLAALKTLRTQLLADATCKEKGGLTRISRERCMAIVKDAIAAAEAAGIGEEVK